MRNKYEIRGDVTAIFVESPKYGKKEVLISTNMLELVNSFPNRWAIQHRSDNKTFYVKGDKLSETGKREKIYLHRLIAKAPVGMVVDHINHDTMDNRNSNLRVVTQSENLQNRDGAQTNNKTSGIRGVSWHKQINRWIAYIKINRKRKHVGCFETVEEAERAVIQARIKHMPYSPEAKAL